MLSKCVSCSAKFKTQRAFEPGMVNVHRFYVSAQILLSFRNFRTICTLEEIGRNADYFTKNGGFQLLKITNYNTA